MTNITPLDFDPNRRERDRESDRDADRRDREPLLGRKYDRRLHLCGVPDEREQGYQGIGTEFAAARIRAGLDVAGIAGTLRIRKEHLSAIEEGRFGDLPAPAYALGFVRSYADHLGLAAAAAVEAFKQETSATGRRTPLVFPIAERAELAPRGWLLAMSVVLAAVVFGAWYYSERTGDAVVERVPAPPVDGPVTAIPAARTNIPTVEVRATPAVVPAPLAPAPQVPAPQVPVPQVPAANLDPAIGRVLGVIPALPPAAIAPATPPPAAANRPGAAPAPALTAAAPPNPAPLPAVEPESEAAPAGAAGSEPVAVVEVLAPPVPDAAVGADPIVTTPAILVPAPAAPALTTALALAVPPTLPPALAGGIPTVIPAVPPAAPIDLAAANREGQTFGAVSGRVHVLATQDSWLQVTGAAGELLLTRILHAGDKYIAPPRDDLVLMTGNAGALEVFVDGKVIPSLGPAGTVRRNVSLSPEKLLNGTAIQP